MVIVDGDGISVADSDPPAPGRRDFSTRTELVTALSGRVATGTRFSDTLDERLLYVAVPVASGGIVHGAVRITYPTAELDRRVARNWLLLAAVAAVVLAAAALASFLIARSVSRPLRRLERTAVALADGRLSARADADAGPPEVRSVAATFNTMAGRLEQLLASQRTFVADASHQLRTPLTALRLRLENLETAVSADAAGELAAAIDETSRLGRLVEGLLTLARTDGTPADPVTVDAVELLRRRYDTWRPVVEDRGAELGPGMSAVQRERAFDRFWRSGPTGQDGFGLGLAIVDRLVLASGGTVELCAAPGEGLDVVVRLRAARASDPGPAGTPAGRQPLEQRRPEGPARLR